MIEWLQDRLDPRGVERRREVRSIRTSIDHTINQLFSGPENLTDGKVYHVFPTPAHYTTSIRVIYPGFPPIDEINVILKDPKYEFVLHWDRQLSYAALIKYEKREHRIRVESSRDIDFRDEVLRLKFLKEVLEVVRAYKSSAREQPQLSTLIPI